MLETTGILVAKRRGMFSSYRYNSVVVISTLLLSWYQIIDSYMSLLHREAAEVYDSGCVHTGILTLLMYSYNYTCTTGGQEGTCCWLSLFQQLQEDIHVASQYQEVSLCCLRTKLIRIIIHVNNVCSFTSLQVHLPSQDLLIFVIHDSGNHWSLLVRASDTCICNSKTTQ